MEVVYGSSADVLARCAVQELQRVFVLGRLVGVHLHGLQARDVLFADEAPQDGEAPMETHVPVSGSGVQRGISFEDDGVNVGLSGEVLVGQIFPTSEGDFCGKWRKIA